MLWSQFSAIFDNFQRKKWRFYQTPMLLSIFCIIWNCFGLQRQFLQKKIKIITSVSGHTASRPLSQSRRRPSRRERNKGGYTSTERESKPGRPAGWPDEFVKKIAQNVAQLLFVKIITYVILTVGKSRWMKNVVFFGNFQKTAPSIHSRMFSPDVVTLATRLG
jgi:hypothetical protein